MTPDEQQFEQWALSPNGIWGYNPHDNPKEFEGVFFSPQEVWRAEQKAFSAGMMAERERLRELIIGRMKSEYHTNNPSACYELRKVLSWLTAGNEPATPKTDRK